MVEWYFEICLLCAFVFVLGVGIKIGRVIEKSDCICDKNISIIIGGVKW